MAIYHMSAQVISRGAGRSAINAAAYRRAARMVNEETGERYDYRNKRGIVHAELSVPEDAPEWVKELATDHATDPNRASEALWNKVEIWERRKDAQLVRELNAALPKELSEAQNVALVREFVSESFVSRGMIADWTLHYDNPKNPHAHIMITMRPATAEGFGSKQQVVLDEATGAPRLKADGRPEYRDIWGTKEQLQAWRAEWAEVQNEHLAAAGVAERVDHRSHKALGLELEPTRHLGLAANAMTGRGLASDRYAQHHGIRGRNVGAILDDPGQFYRLVTHRQATFTRRDMARALGRFIDDPAQFQSVLSNLESSLERVEVLPERINPATGRREPTRYSTQELIGIESRLIEVTNELIGATGYQVREAAIDTAIEAMDRRVAEATGGEGGLTSQQEGAIRTVTAPGRLAVVVGYAGAGKTTILEGAREAWEAGGYRVRGAALSGIAAENLAGSGIPAHTLASLEVARGNALSMVDEIGRSGRLASPAQQAFIDQAVLTKGDVLVIDEAGMIGTRQMGRVLDIAAEAGAKVVLVGDAEQLPAIEAGSPFANISEWAGVAELTEIRRQAESWARTATAQFASERTRDALTSYFGRGHVHFVEAGGALRDGAKATIVAEYLARENDHPERSRAIMAHSRADVADLNARVRAARQAAGDLGDGLAFQTAEGPAEFAAGDRLLFRRNSAELGVKNGTLGTVRQIEAERLVVELDKGGSAVFDPGRYNAFQHGYAATVHKLQGMTVDEALVLASPMMDRHLAYVAMSRHRLQADLYADPREFETFDALAAHLSRGGLEVSAHDHISAAAAAEPVDLLKAYDESFRHLEEVQAARKGGRAEAEVVERAKGAMGDIARAIVADPDYRSRAAEAGRLAGIEIAQELFDSSKVDPLYAARQELETDGPVAVFDQAADELGRISAEPTATLDARKAASLRVSAIARVIVDTAELRDIAAAAGRLEHLEAMAKLLGPKAEAAAETAAEAVLTVEPSAPASELPSREREASPVVATSLDSVRGDLSAAGPLTAFDQAVDELGRVSAEPGASLDARKSASLRVGTIARVIVDTAEHRDVAAAAGRLKHLEAMARLLGPKVEAVAEAAQAATDVAPSAAETPLPDREASPSPASAEAAQTAGETSPDAPREPALEAPDGRRGAQAGRVEATPTPGGYQRAIEDFQKAVAEAVGPAGKEASARVDAARQVVADRGRQVLQHSHSRALASLAGMVAAIRLFQHLFHPVEGRGRGIVLEDEAEAQKVAQREKQSDAGAEAGF